MRRRRIAVAVALVAAAPAAAAVSAPRGDPRGTIAFVRFSPRIGHPRIAVLGLARRTVRRLPLPGQATEAPAWSPDGRLLAFVSGRNAANAQDIVGPAVLYVGTSDGRNLRRLTPSSARAGASSWSPDATRLVFVRSSPSGARSTLWTVGVDGSGLRRITNGSLDSEPSWSPDGRAIAFLRIDPKTFRGGVWVVHPDGSGLRRIIPRVNDAAEPVWSPDGTWLLVHDSRTVYSVRPDGRDLRALVHLAADAHGALEDPQPAWSPDGTWIVFCQFRRAAVSRSDLWTVRADGTGLRRLTRSPGLDTDPSWGS